MSSEVAISAVGLSKRYDLGVTGSTGSAKDALRRVLRPFRPQPRQAFLALDDVSFSVGVGEIVGLIGRNGAGKSTLLKILSRVTGPTSGRVEIFGRLGSLLEVGTGFHPEMTGRENVYLNGAILGLDRRAVSRRFDDIVEFSGVGAFLDTPVKRYSSGMFVRLAFAVAAHLDTDVLVVDEVLAVGDAQFQERCLGRMKELSGTGRTVVLVSHNMSSITRLCTRGILLDGGRIVLDGSPAEVVSRYLGGDEHGRAERVWADDQRPGDDVANLRRVAVLDRRGLPTSQVAIDEGCEILIEYEFRTTPARLAPIPHLRLLDSTGTMLLLSLPDPLEAAPGTVSATCIIPPNLLNEGLISVHVGVSTLTPAIDHALEPDAVSFTAVDPEGRSPARRGYQKTFPGALRPMLDWDLRRTDGGPSRSEPSGEVPA